jgi:hypothetical protein
MLTSSMDNVHEFKKRTKTSFDICNTFKKTPIKCKTKSKTDWTDPFIFADECHGSEEEEEGEGGRAKARVLEGSRVLGEREKEGQ